MISTALPSASTVIQSAFTVPQDPHWAFALFCHARAAARDTSGQWVGLGDAGAQAAQVYANIGRILAHIGATPQDVVKIMVFLTDRADSAAVSAERKKFFGDHRPPHSGIIIGGLGSPEVKVEVEVIVYLPKAR